MKRAFVDSSAFYALIVLEDENHERAHEVFARANTERWRLVTTNAIVYEAHALLLVRSRPGRKNALALLDMVAGDAYEIQRVTPADEARAIALIRAEEDKTYSLCDAMSFAVMERLGVVEALAYDRHFRTYGRLIVL